MNRWLNNMRAAWLIAGIIIGLFVGGLVPDSPLHATATDRSDSFALATGMLEEGIEAIYTLDFLTGDLNAYVLSPATRQFSSMYKRNILADLRLEQGKAPKFLMVSGSAELRGGGQSQFSEAVVYVAELTGGMLGVYALPFNPGAIQRLNPVPQPVALLQVLPFRTTAVRQ
ncbi:MAG TPA: hypothetical protein VHY20_05345 [Pirellulales bacterium]|jgi:hypothetical protein|nr:hypothetical protein [Pirellulales bacterium]